MAGLVLEAVTSAADDDVKKRPLDMPEVRPTHNKKKLFKDYATNRLRQRRHYGSSFLTILFSCHLYSAYNLFNLYNINLVML